MLNNNFIDENEDFDDGSENPTLQLINQIKDTSDLYYISLLLLDRLGESKSKYSATAELAYLVDLKSFLNIVYYYGGKTIRIPTPDELQNNLRLISLYYYYDIKGFGWKESPKPVIFRWNNLSYNERKGVAKVVGKDG